MPATKWFLRLQNTWQAVEQILEVTLFFYYNDSSPPVRIIEFSDTIVCYRNMDMMNNKISNVSLTNVSMTVTNATIITVSATNACLNTASITNLSSTNVSNAKLAVFSSASLASLWSSSITVSKHLNLGLCQLARLELEHAWLFGMTAPTLIGGGLVGILQRWCIMFLICTTTSSK